MTAYREDGRDALNEVDSLAERVRKLEEKPAKEPSKPWTKRESMAALLVSSVVFCILAGLAPSFMPCTWPLSIGLGAAALICLVALIAPDC